MKLTTITQLVTEIFPTKGAVGQGVTPRQSKKLSSTVESTNFLRFT